MSKTKKIFWVVIFSTIAVLATVLTTLVNKGIL
jgi:hypothetical protein